MPDSKPKPTINEYLDKQTPAAKKLTNQIRQLIFKTLPTATEDVNSWGNPTYRVNGKAIAWIINYPNHVDLGFFYGSKLKSDLLEGTGQNFRHLKVAKPKDIDQAEFSRLLLDASRLDI